MTEFYYQLWSKKNQWQTALKNVKSWQTKSTLIL
jgi:hypothetical protein